MAVFGFDCICYAFRKSSYVWGWSGGLTSVAASSTEEPVFDPGVGKAEDESGGLRGRELPR